jgi:hypothetical protein
MYLSLGNDIAFGLPLMSNLYPKFVPYLLFMCSFSELVLNPMCYFLFELSSQKKMGGKFKCLPILKNVFGEPMVRQPVLNAIYIASPMQDRIVYAQLCLVSVSVSIGHFRASRSNLQC